MRQYNRTLFLVIALLTTARAPLAQQQVSTQLSINAGSATDITGVTSRAASVSPSLTIGLSQRVALALSASGTQFVGGAWSALAGVAAMTRQPLGPLALTLDSRASFTETSYDRSYLIADLTPALEASWHSLTVFGGVHVSRATHWVAAPQAEFPLPGPFDPPIPSANSERIGTTASGRSALYGANVRVPIGGAASVALGVREERGRVATVQQTDRLFTASATRGAISLAGSVGAREANDERTSIGTAALSLMLSPTTAFYVAGGKYAANRLTGATDGRFVNAGFSLALSGNEKSLPKPAGTPPPAAGMTRVSIAARDASRVELAGDFTQWALKPAQRAPNGVWYLDLAVAPGRYRYAFRIDGKEWRTPEGAATADDGFGGKSALLTIERTGRNSS